MLTKLKRHMPVWGAVTVAVLVLVVFGVGASTLLYSAGGCPRPATTAQLEKPLEGFSSWPIGTECDFGPEVQTFVHGPSVGEIVGIVILAIIVAGLVRRRSQLEKRSLVASFVLFGLLGWCLTLLGEAGWA